MTCPMDLHFDLYFMVSILIPDYLTVLRDGFDIKVKINTKPKSNICTGDCNDEFMVLLYIALIYGTITSATR